MVLDLFMKNNIDDPQRKLEIPRDRARDLGIQTMEILKAGSDLAGVDTGIAGDSAHHIVGVNAAQRVGISYPCTSCSPGPTYPNPNDWTIIRTGTYFGVSLKLPAKDPDRDMYGKFFT